MNIRRVKSERNSGTVRYDLPRTEIGEIDTRVPFKSVKAAVSLFGEVALSKARPQPPTIKPKISSDNYNMVDKETQLLLAQKAFNNIKQKLESAEATKSKAGNDLKSAKVTLEDVSKRLETVSESKQSAVQAIEDLKEQARQLQLEKSENNEEYNEHETEMDSAKDKYDAVTSELVAAKQEINEIRRNFDAALETKLAAFQQAADAHSSAKAQSERVKELSNEISDMKETIQQIKLATKEASQEQVNNAVEKADLKETYKKLKEDAERKLISAKKDYDPEQAAYLLEKLDETNAQIEAIQGEMKKAHALEMDSAKAVTEELSEASITLQKVVEEETSLRRSMTSLRQELEEVKRKQTDLREKEAERDRAVAEEDELNASKIFEHSVRLQELSSDIQHTRKEAEEMKKNAQQLKREAEVAQKAAEEAQQKLEIALKQAEEAKAAEKKVLEKIQVLSEKRDIANLEANPSIKISTQKFQSLNMKIVESRNMAEAKVAAANSGLQAINARKAETDKKLEEMSLTLQEIEIAKELAENSANMAEAAQKVLEDELKSWR